MTLAIASARMTEGKTSATIFLPLGSAGESEPGSFQMIASSLDPGGCTSVKSGVPICHNPLALLKVNPGGLQSQTF